MLTLSFVYLLVIIYHYKDAACTNNNYDWYRIYPLNTCIRNGWNYYMYTCVNGEVQESMYTGANCYTLSSTFTHSNTCRTNRYKYTCNGALTPPSPLYVIFKYYATPDCSDTEIKTRVSVEGSCIDTSDTTVYKSEKLTCVNNVPSITKYTDGSNSCGGAVSYTTSSNTCTE
jgi:hypothetical protein